MNNMRRIIIFSLVIGLCFLASIAGNNQTVQAEEKKVVLSFWCFWDEPERFIDRFEDRHPNIKIEMTIVPCEEYLNELKPILRSGRNAPDIFMGEYAHVKEIVESGYWDDLSQAPYHADVSEMLPYVAKVGTDSKGKLRGLSWQAAVGGFIYRRSVAKQYLGTDDPKKVGLMLSTPEKFLDTARLINKKSSGAVKLIAGYGDYMHYPVAARKKQFVDKKNKLIIEQSLLDYFETAKFMVDEELTAECGTWSPPWFENMNSDEPYFMGYILPTWGLQYVIKPNAHDTIGDWGICRGPASYFWGGTWLGIYSGSRNKKAEWNNSAAGTGDEAYEDDSGEQVVLSVWSFSDEIEKMIDRFEAKHPDITIELQIIPYMEYVDKIIPVLKAGTHVPDVFMAESGHIGKFIDSNFWEDLSAAPYKADVSDMFPFMVQAGKDSAGKLRALSWQAYVGGFYYRRSIAKQYLGTDDPAKIGEMLSTEEKFIATGLRLHEKSNGKIKLIAGWQDYMQYALAARKKPFVTKDGRFVLDDAVVRLFAVAKVLREQGLTADYNMWSPEWFEAMQEDSEIFGYSFPLWGLQYVLKPNASDSSGDWAVCKGPFPYFWGGSWAGINSDSRNKDAAWKFIKFITLNRETLEWWVGETEEFVNSKAVVNKLKNKTESEYLEGQEYFHYFAAEAPKVDGTLLTEYDYEISNLLTNVINDYLDGSLTQKEAIKQFVQEVKDTFPELIME